MIILKRDEEIERMRESGAIVASALRLAAEKIAPGVTTEELDELIAAHIRSRGAEPSFKGYNGYPASICASINEEVVHGIPGNRALKEGDIVGIDVGAYKNGFHGDSAATFPVGEIGDEAKRLLDATRAALYKGIEMARPGNCLGDISHAVQSEVEAQGFSIVRKLVGHGIGRNMHEDPQVPNYGRPGKGVRLREGMVLAIEPMVNAGGPDVRFLEDDWTVVTADRSLSAHFEHTVAVRKNGPDILTS
ncbi:MAG: type I methionyl aminopeptidase [Candidatus Eisenbacteria bacterium]|nr:type I methionyl aminopeptidase [Candidatus Eisenbacteria bacterium]